MEPVTTRSETVSAKPESYVAKRLVGAVFGLVEIVLGFRFVFKLLGANPGNGFVKFIYRITQFFVGIFEGIFSKVTNSGDVVRSIFEPATLIAIVIVALLAWIVLKLMTPRISNRVEKTFTTTPAEPIVPQQQAPTPPQYRQAPPLPQYQQTPPPPQYQQTPPPPPQEPEHAPFVPSSDDNQQQK